MTTSFHLVTGVVRLGIDAPAELLAHGTDAFYARPNDGAWAGTLCRVLYHESVHFWQVLSSGFVANVVADEWRRIEHFEKEGEVRPQSRLAREYLTPGSEPFSAYQLFECWARYWDVHTRNPARIVEEEGIADEVVPPGEDAPAYTSEAFDRFMQTGADARLYASPYREMLKRAKSDSFLVASVFPALVHAALGSPAPVKFVLEALDRALVIHARGELLCRTGNINFDWLNNWSSILGQVVRPTIADLRLPAFTSGFDVIQRGPLRTHPIYAEYLERTVLLSGRIKMLPLLAGEAAAEASRTRTAEMAAVCDAPMRDNWVVFALPGQPEYRAALGHALPPPRIRFANATLDARRPVTARLAGADETYASVVDRLEKRVDCFTRAEKAVALGLPADAFTA